MELFVYQLNICSQERLCHNQTLGKLKCIDSHCCFFFQNDSAYSTNKDHCDEYEKYEYCKFDPECVWCMKKPDTQEPGCMHRSKIQVMAIAIKIDLSCDHFETSSFT